MTKEFQISTSVTPSDDVWGGRQLINDLQAKARSVLDPLIPDGSSVILLDYPNNSNVGDSLIWLGETAYLRSRNLSLNYVCDLHNYNADRIRQILDSNSIILLNGGGTFGTLWPDEHDFRLKVLDDFPGIPVIQMPQSIHFEDTDVLSKTVAAISKHGKYTLLIRDQVGHDFAVEHFDCPVHLCPDMAFFIGAINCNLIPLFDYFILSRTDSEKSANWLDALLTLDKNISMDQSDWLNIGWKESIILRIERWSSSLRAIFDVDNRLLLKLWNYLSDIRLKRGQTLLQRGKVVISDRLHVHILSILLNKPHVVIDNKYRKLGNLHDAWTFPYRGVRFVTNLEDALNAAHELKSEL